MRTLLLSVTLSLVSSIALPSAKTVSGCDPCLCGNGGTEPPPTGCGYGPFAGRR